jgi:retinoid hydroxylase
MTATPLNALPVPPGSLGLPFIGETLQFLRDPNFARKRHQQYGAVFKTRILGKPTIFTMGAEANRFVLSNENKYFRVSWPPSTTALLGPLSLSLQTGGHHQQRRKLLAQAFQPRALSGYIGAIETLSQQYFSRWEQLGTLTWYPELRNYTLDIACKLFLDLNHGSQSPLGHFFETWCAGLFSIPLRLPGTPFARAMTSRSQLLSTLEAIVRERQTQPGEDDALGLLIQARDENGQGLSIEELKDQVLLLLFAGHETLTSALSSFCLLMAQHPEILAKVRAEQQQFSASEPITLEQLKQMTYLDRVLREVLRLIPPVGGGFREVVESCEFQGYRLPQGWIVSYGINNTHLDATVYPQPDRFNPDRFDTQQGDDRGQVFGYVPFGGGLRECLGKEFARLEMKLFAARLVRGYEWELLPQNLEMIVVPTPHPRDGLQVKFRRVDEK